MTPPHVTHPVEVKTSPIPPHILEEIEVFEEDRKSVV